MNESQIYIAISVVILAIIATMVVFIGKKKQQARLSKFAVLSFVFILAGIIFGESRLVGYSLIGVGVLFAAIDIIRKLKKS
jgi:hypothetical protein